LTINLLKIICQNPLFKIMRKKMKKNNSSITLDNYGKGLLIGIISRAISEDKSLAPDDIEKLKEIKKELQEI
jgi:hypothetical protein